MSRHQAVYPDPSRSPEETELWQAFVRGDEHAFGILAQRYYKRLYGYGSKFSNDREFVKDCIQDLFMEMWDSRAHLSEPHHLRIYLLVSLRRKILRRKKEMHWLDEDADFDSGLGGVTLPSEEDIIERESGQYNHRKIRHLMTRLTPRQQEIIYLRFYENLDNEAIASVMSVSRQSVANLLWKTLRELKEHWFVGLAMWLVAVGAIGFMQ